MAQVLGSPLYICGLEVGSHNFIATNFKQNLLNISHHLKMSPEVDQDDIVMISKLGFNF